VDAPFWGLLGQWGPDALTVGLLGAFVYAILTGRLVPRRVLEERVNDQKERTLQIAEERDGWKSAHETSEGTRRIMAEQVEKLIAMGTVTNQLLSSIKGEAQER
jgi:hypothetical protein